MLARQQMRHFPQETLPSSFGILRVEMKSIGENGAGQNLQRFIC
eukprot:COSAG02_NODE_4696_length_5085_cov_2.504813_4_plen_44_part_00